MKKDKNGYYRHDFSYEGKQYTVRAKTQKDLWKKIALKEEQLRTGQIIINENTHVNQWMLEFIETYKKPAITDKTLKQLLSYNKNYIFPSIGNMRMKDIKSTHLQKILNMCQNSSKSHVDKLTNLVKGAFKRAYINQVILHNPAEGLEKPSATEGHNRAITEMERKYILSLAENHRAGLWIKIMLYAGLRPVETRELKWIDVDFSTKTLFVKSAKTDYGIRKIPIVAPLFTSLLSAKENKESEYVLTQALTPKAHTKTSMRQMWENFRRVLDIEMGAQTFRGSILPETSKVAADLTPYCLRHTFCTDLQTAGVPINVAKDLMGHSSIELTAKIYTHLSDESYLQALSLMETLDNARSTGRLVSLSSHFEKTALDTAK